MNLGENIYRLRTGKNMSQGDLADALEVSRQSVSKWENNSAVPELDKLMKMRDVFGVTLDELADGGDPTVQASPGEPDIEPEPAPTHAKPTSGTVPGFIFLFCAVAVCLLVNLHFSLPAAILCSLPLWVCGILCLCLKRRRGLWCCWVLAFSASIPVFAGTSISLVPFWNYFVYLSQGTSGTVKLLAAFFTNAVVILLSLWTVHAYRRSAAALAGKRRLHLLLGWILTLLPHFLSGVLTAVLVSLRLGGFIYSLLIWSNYLLGWIHLAAVLAMLILTIGLIQTRSSAASSPG